MRKLCWLFIALVALSGSGCAYFGNRGNDALDIFDVGFTVSKDPGVAVYCGFNSILPIGGAYVDGWLIGLGRRHVGIIQTRSRGAGLLLWGQERWGCADNYNPSDPSSPPFWRVGAIGLAEGPPPDWRNVFVCPKMIHLGWVGFALNCKLGEMADFLLGWTTIDIMKDDTAGVTGSTS